MKVLFCYTANLGGGVIGHIQGHAVVTVKKLDSSTISSTALALMTQLKEDNPPSIV